MDTQEALHQLGVTDQTLTAAEKEALDRDGFLPLYGILSEGQVQAMRKRLDELLAIEGASAGLEVHQEEGAQRLSDLINKDPMFDVCITHPRVLAAIEHVLGREFKSSSLNFRAALPGYGLQAIHADYSKPVQPGDYHACNSIWLLDDFTPQNGPTRVVPGTNRSGKLPREEMPDLKAAHPNEIQLIAPAGTVVVFNAHTWHGGTLNTTDQRRRALHSYFCRREEPQQLDQRKYIRDETYQRLSPAVRYLLDVER